MACLSSVIPLCLPSDKLIHMHESRKWSLVDLSHRVSNGRPPSRLSSLKQAFHAGFRKLFKVFASPPSQHPTLPFPSIHLHKANPGRQHLLICHKTLYVSHQGPDAACVLFEQLHFHSTLRYRRYCRAAIQRARFIQRTERKLSDLV